MKEKVIAINIVVITNHKQGPHSISQPTCYFTLIMIKLMILTPLITYIVIKSQMRHKVDVHALTAQKLSVGGNESAVPHFMC